ncbi:hypothetical protein ACOKFD_11570 [Flagellimonas sp. S174]|uniref:hypothetical protein n=1 Tax=Flagellimonas sp. S174 TaxID=3410790 RepID=UPI003BF5E493
MTKRLIFLVVFVFACLSCEVDEIPETDNEAPAFSFKITGDGFDRTFTQEDSFEDFQLNLRGNVEYEFILSGSDQGGVENISFLFSNESIQLQSSIPEGWEVTDNGFSTTIQFDGDRNNPITGNILAGRFIATGQFTGDNLLSDAFLFQVTDYGGADGTSRNVTRAELTLLIGELTTEIIPL